jgi:uncharacterized membrane protein YbhN (UPF0104 family)
LTVPGTAGVKRERQSFDSPVVPSGRRASIALVVAVLLVVGVGVLIAQAAGFAEVREAIESADASWFAVCLAAQVLALGAYADVVRGAFRWRGGPDPGWGLSTRVLFGTIGAARVFALGGIGAIAAAYWCFWRAGFSADEAIVRVLGFNILFYVSLGVGAWGAALVSAVGLWGDESLLGTLPWLVLGPAVLGAGAILTRPGRGTAAQPRPGGTVVRRALAYAVAGAAWVRDVLVDAAGRRLVLASALYWAGNVLCLWAALRSVGETLPLPELLLGFALGQVAMLLPLPLGGVGGVDAAMTFALTAVGVPLAPALVAVGVYRLFAFWAPTIPALAALVLLPRTGRRLQRLAVEPP